MGARKQFTDCFTVHTVDDVTANASDEGTADAGVLDTENCTMPSVIYDVSDLGANTSVSVSLQHSDESDSGFETVTGLATDLDPAREVSADGVGKAFYAGERRYVRLRVTSNDANPGATVRVTYLKVGLTNKPSNLGI